MDSHIFQKGQDFTVLPSNCSQMAKILPMRRWPAGSDTQGDLDFIYNFIFFDKRHWQLIRSKLGFYFSSDITLDIDVFFFGALPFDQSKKKHTKKLNEIPSRHVLENLPEKASMYAFIHLKLISNLQGFCQYIMADMLNLTIADNKKYSAVALLGP